MGRSNNKRKARRQFTPEEKATILRRRFSTPTSADD
jgi:hypothetical protein